MKQTIIYLINFYQLFLSFDNGILRLFASGGACRYNTSCSEYTKQMVKQFGSSKGILMGLKRVTSCSPFTA